VNETQKADSSCPSLEARGELIELLEFEIARIEKEQERPGWTKWALAGAVASCGWLLLDQFESHSNLIKISNALFLLLI
jgi:hypothetical protein